MRYIGLRLVWCFPPSHLLAPSARSLCTRSFYTGVTIHRVNGDDTLGDAVDITGLPPHSKINFLSWSPDGQHLAFTVRGDGEEGDNGEKQAGRQLSLWVADVATGKARQLLGPPHAAINAVFDSYAWLDGSTLIASIIPPGHPPLPTRPAVPPGPKISDNQGGVAAQSRTFTDLLKDEFDARLLEHFAMSQIVRIDINDPEGTMMPVGPPDMYMSVEPSHDGKYLLVERMCRPFSFEVPCGRFPRRVEVWRSDTGDLLQLVADLPLADNIPVTFNSVRTGRRSINWRPDVPNCLYWVETQDGGDAKVDASPRDIVYTLPADPKPAQQPQQLCRLDLRYGGITWGDEGLALVYESWFKTRRTRTWAIAPGGASGPLPPDQRPPPKLIFDRSYEDRYSDPGGPLLRRTSMGTYVLAQVRMPDGALRLLLAGDGASPEGNVPFLDLFDRQTGEKERVWRSDTDKYFETMYSLLGDQEEGPIDLKDLKLILSRESKDDPPQSFVKRWADGSEVQLTHFPHPYPSLRGLSKEIIRYSRSDGVQLTAKLFLPPGYSPATDGPLPMVLWAYPREYKSKEAAGQVQGSPNQFPGIGASSPLLFLARGYAVLSGPSMPIIGQGEEEANDRFVEQLVSSAEAAVDEVVRRGVAQRDKIAIGGHSYGAFMAANLLAHAPHLFACAIAQSGAYNRTLTPFSFQSEERTLWQVPEVYMTMSPFLAADRIKSPILLVHGQDDNNTGTFPMQTERFFAALKGHGVTTRMVLLPHEGHGYRARESLLHVLAEQSNWLDRYCKNRPAPAAAPGDKESEAGGSAEVKTNEPVGAAVEEGAKEENGHELDGSWLRASLLLLHSITHDYSARRTAQESVRSTLIALAQLTSAMAASCALPAATGATLGAFTSSRAGGPQRSSPRVGFPLRRRTATIALRCSASSPFLASPRRKLQGARFLTVRAAAKSGVSNTGGATEQSPKALQRQGSLGVCDEKPSPQSSLTIERQGSLQVPTNETDTLPPPSVALISVPEPLDEGLIEPSSPRASETGVDRIESQARTTLSKLKHILYKIKTRAADVQTSVTVYPPSAGDAAGIPGVVAGSTDSVSDTRENDLQFDGDANGGKVEEEQQVFVSQQIKLDLGSIPSVDLDVPIDIDASSPSDVSSVPLSPSSFSAQSLSTLFSGFSPSESPAAIPASEQQLDVQQMDSLTCTRASIRFDEETQTAIVTVTASVRAADLVDRAAYTERTMAMATRAIARTCLVLDQKAQRKAAEAVSSASQPPLSPAAAATSVAQPPIDTSLLPPQIAPEKADDQVLTQEQREQERELVELLSTGRIVSWRMAGRELGSTPFRPLYVVNLAAADGADGEKTVQALYRPVVGGDARLRFQRAPAEWVAYKLSRVLGLDVVPPVAVRQGVQLGSRRFAQGTMTLLPHLLHPLASVHPSRLRAPAQAHTVISSIRILDALMGSSLRRPAGFFAAQHWSGDGKLSPVVLSHPIGPSLGAGLHAMWSKRGTGAGGRLKTVAGFVLTRLRRMNRAQLLEEMGGALTAGEMERVLDKRDQMVGYFDALAAKMGHQAVVR
ncbi:unnamed protein product [Closterium sp. Yama58-4]|nr:unnamed protein product [Closterium sp. Yama58-4]